ncbi:bifunctional metallophosphatase/5'-nucleotidase [Corynebacterium crudilactis]|uniref:Bifunctional metallophosphatase/5'-nucleotidase n=1 Tax=Corynebacterium crudilactis TaxID=1652495 RepID=A0A172QQ42_9CORY|nr:bifunctional UDP-sugar hydrolase/5'-nucleotidase [Corynebacterium crudilactis]ANE02791.1 bifunctional metallophosphatase/5'-nucleotidase [Corynebacterium crudilactis]
MPISKIRIVIAASAVVSSAIAGVSIAQAQEELAQFNITNITDYHGYISATKAHPGAAMLKCAVDNAADGLPQAFVSSGDNIGGSPFASSILDDEPTLDVLNQMGLDFSAVGNHEFDKGYADLTGRVADLANFEYLGANVEGGNPGLAPYGITELDGVKVAFVGTVSQETPMLVNSEGIEGITFSDPVAMTNRVADQLVESGEADVVVALFHEGISGTEQWSENIDAIFAGHTHQVRNLGTDQGPLIMQAGNYGHALADVDFSYNRSTDELIVNDARILGVEEINACGTPDSAISKIVAQAEIDAGEAGKEVVATIEDDFLRALDEGAESGSNYGAESQLVNMIANAVRWSMTTNTATTADIGLMNAGGLRADLFAGEVTYAEAFEIQPFAGEDSFVTLKGADFKDVLEQQWKENSARPVAALGVSDNVSYTYDINRPIGDRITSVSIDGAPLDPARDYVVAASVYLLSGNEGMEALTRGTAPAQTGIVDVQSTIGYLANNYVVPRYGQAQISVTPSSEFNAGETITLDLAGLRYTQSDTATEVTVSLGDVIVSAPIEPTLGAAGFGEAGTATVNVEIPADLSGAQELVITTDAGTHISMPVSVVGAQQPQPQPQPAGSSILGTGLLSGILGIFAGIFGAIGVVNWIDPTFIQHIQQRFFA